MSSVDAELAEQTAANLSGVAQHAAFSGHRERLTALLTDDRVPKGSPLRLCVLGAGNCNDLDLSRLAEHYTEIHLVDIDPTALERAFQRQDEATRRRLVRHAPVDLSGLVDRLERWAAFRVTPEELMEHATNTAASVEAVLGGRFDVVLSACVLTQMQLMVVNVLTDAHPLFEAVRHTLTLTHLRTLERLLAPRGRALLATDVSSDQIAPLGQPSATDDLRPLLAKLTSSGHIFHVAQPAQFTEMVRDDPTLRRTVSVSEPVSAWPWQNGPHRLFLVYGLELQRLP